MTWYVAGTMFVAGTYGAVGKRKGARAAAAERRRAARESLITAKFNIHERNKESKQTMFATLESGAGAQKEVAIQGLQAEGSATVSAGGSGAQVESGTSRAVLSNIVQESLAAQTHVMIDTKNRIKAIKRDTENQNRSEWRNAKLHQQQQNRIANRETEAAEKEFYADMIETTVSSYAGGASMAGTGNITKWGSASKTSTATKAASVASQPGPHAKVASYSAPVKGTGRMPGSTVYKSKPKITGKGITPKKGYARRPYREAGKYTKTYGTWDRLMHQAKTRPLSFTKRGFKGMWDFARPSSAWPFLTGRGIRGKAAKTTFPSMKTGR